MIYGSCTLSCGPDLFVDLSNDKNFAGRNVKAVASLKLRSMLEPCSTDHRQEACGVMDRCTRTYPTVWGGEG